MNNKYILASLASDLKRVALGLHRGSDNMAKRFLEEALMRKNEVIINEIAPYVQKLLTKVNNDLDSENALMLSTLIQNYIQRSL